MSGQTANVETTSERVAIESIGTFALSRDPGIWERAGDEPIRVRTDTTPGLRCMLIGRPGRGADTIAGDPRRYEGR